MRVLQLQQIAQTNVASAQLIPPYDTLLQSEYTNCEINQVVLVFFFFFELVD